MTPPVECTSMQRKVAMTLLLAMSSGAVHAAAGQPSLTQGNAHRHVPLCAEQRETGSTAAAALVIGIGDYTSAADGQAKSGGRAWRNLQGSVNDARAIADLFVNRFGMTCDNVLVLLDADATREQILAGFTDFLLPRAKDGARLYVYYAGHGSQAPNPLTDEADGKDETLVPYDAAAGVADIPDKLIARKLNDLIDRGARVTAVFDSCHSGSVSRSFGEAASHRQLPASNIPVELPSDERGSPQERGAIIISSAGEQQLAREILGADGRHWGAFSHALIHLLWGDGANMSVSELLMSAKGKMRVLGSHQEPRVDSRLDLLDTPLIPSAKSVASGRAVAAVALIDGLGRIQLLGGIDAGLWPEAEVDVAGSGRWCIEREAPAPGRVWARACPGSTVTEPVPGALAYLRRAGYPPVSPLVLQFPEASDNKEGGSSIDTGLASVIEQSLGRDRSAQITRDPDAASHYRLVRDAGSWRWQRSIDHGLALPSTTKPVSLDPAADSIAALRGQITQIARAYTWQSLDVRDTADFPFRFELRVLDLADGARSNDKAGRCPKASGGVPIAADESVPAGSRVELVAVRTGEPVDVDPLFGTTQPRHLLVVGFGENTEPRMAVAGVVFPPTDCNLEEIAVIRFVPDEIQHVHLAVLTSVEPIDGSQLLAHLSGLRSGSIFASLRNRGRDRSTGANADPRSVWGLQHLRFRVVEP